MSFHFEFLQFVTVEFLTLEFVTVVLFGVLVALTIIFGGKNLKYLNKLFYQTQERNMIELRPIIILDYLGILLYSSNDTQIHEDAARKYLKNKSYEYVKIVMNFTIKNIGKMVAQNIEIDWDIKGPSAKRFKEKQGDADLAPTEKQALTAQFTVTEFKKFVIDITIMWKYGQAQNGKLVHSIQYTPFTPHRLFNITKKIFFDWKDKS